jgi:hypothetical protein
MTLYGATPSIVFWPIVFALVVAGCGGSSGESSGSTTASASTGGKNTRLSQASWNEYTAVAEKARTVNKAAIATFSRCRDVAVSAQDPDKVKACLGNSTTSVVTTGKQTLTELDKITSEATGACAKASEELTGYVKIYVASVDTVGTSVAQATLPSTASIDNASTALKHARATDTAFVAACKPAGAA